MPLHDHSNVDTRKIRALVFRVCCWCLIAMFAFTLNLAIAKAADKEFPPELVRFEAAEGNPIFAARGPGHWDVRLRERGWILRDNNRYHMWFTGYDGTRAGIKRLGHATSVDGRTWKRDSQNPYHPDHWIEDMMVVKKGKTFYMFAEGDQDRSQLLTSVDGVHWKRQGPLDIRTKNHQPIERGPYGTPVGWYENGTWYLFYERRDLGIWLATSKDMKIWTHVQDKPVLSPGPGVYDEKMVAFNQIVKYKGRYYAYYHGSAVKQKPSLWSTNVAVSTDLVNWKKFSGNPLFPTAENKSSGILVHDGKQFRLYTMHNEVHLHLPRKK